ncbi:unnamed protein product [Protopolystoma xenopodis]|uniref:Uncharacterized protein n=1 Tax=Protopolystoma xenopodis TaxID=117903 RepID=A0A3S4ZXF7_9PLAT|nr:unnamed protein product [Protopolystoma xenopodis]
MGSRQAALNGVYLHSDSRPPVDVERLRVVCNGAGGHSAAKMEVGGIGISINGKVKNETKEIANSNFNANLNGHQPNGYSYDGLMHSAVAKSGGELRAQEFQPSGLMAFGNYATYNSHSAETGQDPLSLSNLDLLGSGLASGLSDPALRDVLRLSPVLTGGIQGPRSEFGKRGIESSLPMPVSLGYSVSDQTNGPSFCSHLPGLSQASTELQSLALAQATRLLFPTATSALGIENRLFSTSKIANSEEVEQDQAQMHTKSQTLTPAQKSEIALSLLAELSAKQHLQSQANLNGLIYATNGDQASSVYSRVGSDSTLATGSRPQAPFGTQTQQAITGLQGNSVTVQMRPPPPSPPPSPSALHPSLPADSVLAWAMMANTALVDSKLA